MTDLRTAAQQALEAMESTMTNEEWLSVRANLRAALAEPEPPIGKATTDVPVTVYVVKKAHEP